MRSLRIVVCVAVAALVAASAAQAADSPSSKDSWTSFKPGSSATLKTWIKTTPEVPRLMGKGELRMTLVSISDEEYVVKSEKRSDSGGEWTDSEENTHSRKPTADDAEEAAPAQALGEEKISIEGTAYVCKRAKTISNGATEITWVHKQHGKLKSERSGPGDKKSTTIVTALAKIVTVAEKKVSCREEKTSSSDAGIESTIVQVTSDAVPGGLV